MCHTHVRWLKFIAILIGGLLVVSCLMVSLVPRAARAETASAARDQLQSQLDALEQEAAALDQQIADAENQANTLKNQIKIFDAQIRQQQLQIKRLTIAIQQANIDINVKSEGIVELTARIQINHGFLAKNIAEFDAYDKENILVVLVKNETLSDFFSALDNFRSLQDQTKHLLDELQDNQKELEQEKSDLEDYRAEQLSLKSLAEVERKAVEEKKAEKNQLLALTKGKESLYQQLLAKKKQDIAALQNQLFYIERTGITAADALKYANLAASRSGIRTAFLLALLEVETGKQFEDGVITAGTYLGTGNWKTDMYDCYVNLGRTSAAEAQKAAFFKITSALSLNPDQMPVSRKPSYGCGGAMGPAQFIPTTWLLFAPRVADLTGHNLPSPWNVEDAFTAAAIFLADAGARSQNRTGELAAAHTYISGKASCPASGSARIACQAYGNRIFSLAADIDKVI